MRRRIDTFETFRDCTTEPHLYFDVYHGEVEMHDPALALYDDALWTELREAQAKLSEVEGKIYAAAVREPLDRVEVALGRELWDMAQRPLGPSDRARQCEIEAELVAHAKTLTAKR